MSLRRTASIVVVRRRTPVHLAVLPQEQAADLYADGRHIDSIHAPAAVMPAVSALLAGPAWLMLVAAGLPEGILARLWVMVPAAEPDAGMQHHELHDDEPVYAYLLAELSDPLAGETVTRDLREHAGRLLESATRPERPMLAQYPVAA